MPDIDVVDSTWLAAPVATVAPIVADPANWPRWWPGLVLGVDELRGPKGVRWSVASVAEAAGLAGSAELWLEPMSEGVVAHFFLRLDDVSGRPLSGRARIRITDRYRCLTKRAFWALGDRLDPDRRTRHTRVPPPPPPGH